MTTPKTPTPAKLTPDTLTKALLANPAERTERAALDLLIWHETWINQLVHNPACADMVVIDPPDTGEERCARIRWEELAAWANGTIDPPQASTSALLVLDVALSLASDAPVGLRALASDNALGAATKRRVLDAITASFGDIPAHPVWTPHAV